MNQVLMKAKIAYDPSMISAAADLKSFSNKRVIHILVGLLLIGLAVFGFYGVMYFSFGIPGDWNGAFMVLFGSATNQAGWFGNLMLILLALVIFIISLLVLMFGLGAWFTDYSSWFFILYTDSFLYKYTANEPGEYEAVEVPIADITKCYIIKIKDSVARPFINVHLEYKRNHDYHYASLTYPDGYAEMDTIISYLQDERSIPVYFTFIMGAKTDELEVLPDKESEQIEFKGDLESYI